MIPAREPIDLADWQHPPFNRRTFSRMREYVPTARVAAGTSALPLAEGERIGLDLPVRIDGETRPLHRVLADTCTDGLLVLHRGRIRAEEYFGELTPERTHLLFSVSKSLVGCVAGNLIAQGLLSPTATVSDYVPEMAGSGYRDATVRDILDMRSGVRFSEVYEDVHAEVRQLDQAIGWVPRVDDWVPASLYGYLPMLAASRPHGGAFEYRSCETDVLGWVCERAAGEEMPALLSRLIWARMAEDDLDAGVDRAGTVFYDGGLSATLRDAARFGEALRLSGMGASEVVPRAWIEDALAGAADSPDAFAQSPTPTPPFPGGRYRNQFWIPFPDRRVLLCLGIHGQAILVDLDREAVLVKLSSCPEAVDPALDNAGFAALLALLDALEDGDRDQALAAAPPAR